MKRLSVKLLKTLFSRNLTIALAESVTCGLVLNKLSLVKGTNGTLQGGLCCYDASVKTSLLKVDRHIIERYTPESQQTTDAMARNIVKLIPASVGVAITGLASAGGSETAEKPVGTIFFAVYYKRKLYRHRRLFRGTPQGIQEKAVKELFQFVLDILEGVE